MDMLRQARYSEIKTQARFSAVLWLSNTDISVTSCHNLVKMKQGEHSPKSGL